MYCRCIAWVGVQDLRGDIAHHQVQVEEELPRQIAEVSAEAPCVPFLQLITRMPALVTLGRYFVASMAGWSWMISARLANFRPWLAAVSCQCSLLHPSCKAPDLVCKGGKRKKRRGKSDIILLCQYSWWWDRHRKIRSSRICKTGTLQSMVMRIRL